MDSAFDQILHIINGDESISETDAAVTDEAEMINLTEQIKQASVQTISITPQRELVEIVEFDPNYNILVPKIRERFKHENVFMETDTFTVPIATTTTIEGYLSNVKFHEAELIHEVIPDENILIYRCNYGKAVHDGYVEPVKVKKTNRGRKKKEKKRGTRKKQGNGTEFNSQMTFVVRSSLAPAPIDGKINSDVSVYKFKVFRTGQIQLPGVHQHMIDDVIECAKKVADVVNFHLHSVESNPARLTSLVNMNPVMTNYKFIVKMERGHIIDLHLLKDIMLRERYNQRHSLECAGIDRPRIFVIGYTRQSTKLSLKFITPILKNPSKKTRINIFMRGKINILGALYVESTSQICEYLHGIFMDNYDRLIVPEGGLRAFEPQNHVGTAGNPPPNIAPSALDIISRPHEDIENLLYTTVGAGCTGNV
jgi:hypothetical protein